MFNKNVFFQELQEFKWMSVCTYVRMYVCVWVHTCVCMHGCIHVYVSKLNLVEASSQNTQGYTERFLPWPIPTSTCKRVSTLVPYSYVTDGFGIWRAEGGDEIVLGMKTMGLMVVVWCRSGMVL